MAQAGEGLQLQRIWRCVEGVIFAILWVVRSRHSGRKWRPGFVCSAIAKKSGEKVIPANLKMFGNLGKYCRKRTDP